MEAKFKTTIEKADKYIKRIEEEMSNCSAHEKNGILLEKVRYWYWSAIDWRDNKYAESNESFKKLIEANEEDE